MKKFFFKYEWIGLLLALALVLTAMPLLISAASTPLNLLGFAIGLTYVTWWFFALVRVIKLMNVN